MVTFVNTSNLLYCIPTVKYHHSTAKHLGCPIISSAQSIQQADGSSQLQVVGEIWISFTRDNTEFTFEGLVVQDLDVEVLAGTPFMEANEVAVRPTKREVLLGKGSTYTYGSQAPPSPLTTARRAFVLHAPTPSKTVWPGEFLEVQLPDDAPPDSEYVLKPPTDAPSLRNLKPSQLWPQPSVVRAIRIPNLSTEPRTLKRHEHFCQVKPLSSNQKRSHRQVSLLLSVRYHPLMLVTLHPSR